MRRAADPYTARPLAAMAIVLALIGWLLPLGEAASGVVSEPGIAFGMHPGGILLGLAFLRGTAHATRLDDERIAEFALGPGLAAIAGLWVFLTVSGGTAEAWVVGAASSATVTFITAGLSSVGLARLADLRGSGVRGADRRIWDGVLLAVVVGLLAVSLPLAVILGVPLGGALRGAVQVVTAVLVIVAIPFIWVGAALGWVFYLAIQFLRGLAGGSSTDTGGVIGGPLVDWQGMLGSEGQNGLALGVIPLVVAIVIAFVLIRALVKRPRRSVVVGGVVEVRELEPPTGMRFRRPQVRMPRRHGAPRSASEAYVASLEVLARSARVRAPCVRDAGRARSPTSRRGDRSAAQAAGCGLRASRIRASHVDAVRASPCDRALAAYSCDRHRGDVSAPASDAPPRRPAWITTRTGPRTRPSRWDRRRDRASSGCGPQRWRDGPVTKFERFGVAGRHTR